MPLSDQTDVRVEPHKLAWSDLDEIALGNTRGDVVRRLRHAERSRRLLLLRALTDEVVKRPDLVGPLPPLDDAWELLGRVQDAAPRELNRMLAHPYTGAWAGYTTRLLHNQITGVCPQWVHIGHLHSLAAAAAIHAKINFDTTIPLWNGEAILPTIGMARLPSDDHWSVATVRGDGDRVEISNKGGTVRLPREHSADAPGWWPVQRLSTRTNGLRLSVRLDDLDPYRGLYEPIPPQRLDAAEVGIWHDLFSKAWEHLATCLPDYARAFPAGLDTIAPRPGIPFRNLSASTGEAFGSAIVARPADPASLAATLVHEFHHFLLGGLQHLIPMHEEDTRERFYTLWRQDPRPISGVLHGVYAFFGVTTFWRAFATSGPAAARRRALFEFAYWRAGTWRTLRALSGDASLTEAGQRFVDRIAQRLGPWQDEPVPADLASIAAAAAADHYASWRMRHLRPDPDVVASLATSWLAGETWPDSRRPDDLHLTPTPVPDGTWSGARTELIRYSLTNPDTSRLRDVWQAVPGATAADFAYVSGRPRDAIRDFLAELAMDPEQSDFWVGLGLALSANGADTAGARALLRCPEVVRAVYRRIHTTTGIRPAPDELAVWIGRSVC